MRADGIDAIDFFLVDGRHSRVCMYGAVRERFNDIPFRLPRNGESESHCR